MLIAFSFFCCCLILLWFCTLPVLLVFVVLLGFTIFWNGFWFWFGLVLFFNFAVISQPYFSQPVFCIFGFVLFCYFLLLVFFLFCRYFTTSACQAEKKPTNRLLPFFFFLTWFYMARVGCFVLIREFGSKSLVLNQFLTNNSFDIHVHNVNEKYPIHTKSN